MKRAGKLPLTPREEAAVEYFNAKASGPDEINRLLGPDISYSVYHHFGLGGVPDLDGVLQRGDRGEMNRILYGLERADSNYLIGLLHGRINSTHRVLDAGSGSGGTAFDLYEAYGCSVDGVNIAHEQVEFTNRLAKQRGVDDKVRFHVMNMRGMSFDDDTFDAAVSSETTMYVDINEFYLELARVLKRDGMYAMVSWSRADEHIVDNPYADQIDGHYNTRMHSPQAYQNTLAAHGFVVLHFGDLTEQALDYWRLRLRHPLATGVEKPFLDGYQNGYLKYISISAVNTGK